MGVLGPMLGQHGHFALYAQEKIPYAIERYRDEAARLYRVLDTQLGKTGAYVAGADYSIADIACFPYVALAPDGGVSLDPYPAIRLWSRAIRAIEGFIEMPGIHRLHELKPEPVPEVGEA